MLRDLRERLEGLDEKDLFSSMNISFRSGFNKINEEFLGQFSACNHQRDFKEVVLAEDAGNIIFKEMTARINARYIVNRNKTFAKYEFHEFFQKEGESFDSFAARIKHEEKTCQFSFISETCTIKNILLETKS